MVKNENNKIGLIGATAYIVGSIIGSGIFIAPKGIVEHAGSIGLSLIIWVVCALLNMITAINYIELGTSIPESGAELAYIDYLGWTPIAFSILWLSLLIQTLEPIFCFSNQQRDDAGKFFGFGLLLFLTLTNMFSLKKFAAKIQIISMCSKIFATLIIISIGAFFMIFKGYTAHYSGAEFMRGSNFEAGAIVLAIYQGNWAFGGFTTLNYGTEEIEIKNFEKTLPRASLGGLLISAVIYVCVNIAYFAILTPQEIIASDAVATTFIQRTVGNNAAYAVPAVVGFLLIGTLNGDVFSWSRYMVAGARRNMMPTCFSLIHVDNDSPRVSVFFHTLTSISFAFMGDTDTLVNYLTIIGLLTTIIVLIILVIIKWKNMPVATSAVKYSIFWPILNIVINVALLVIPIQQDPISSIIGVSMFAGGIVLYFLIKYLTWNSWTSKILHIADKYSTEFLQKITWTIVDTGPLEKTRL
ncbi:unnamed protein product [Caenorhabditis angaria]|uniref:Amino acid permease/ SLC12A domain-containing protein n=1 Tax=Caenorhabditis angaria TaxID=860376 RepID=A0A9P1N4P6_9PELO|nr:unnamed protein product [Caenorhabditis angaria]